MTTLDIAILSLACTLLGVGISKIWIGATQFTTMRGEIAKAKQDNNNLGDKVRQLELKLFYIGIMAPETETKKQEILNALVRRLT